MILAFAGDPESGPTIARALEGLGGSPRLAFVCHIVIGWRALDGATPDAELAERSARAALALPVVADLVPAGHALLSRALLAKGASAAGLDEARIAARLQAECRDLELFTVLADVALTEALHASGARDEAERVAREGRARLDALASTIADPEHRRGFYARRMGNDRLA
jgi:hypothetical protein